ncbi:MAG TPA: SurA N-terminal domain-containing protein, partial [Pyrinomonadaceae bacterium]|nr:SurA N-terminal domain-containing protein [Pyrinomonadaceae bacterium]
MLKQLSRLQRTRSLVIVVFALLMGLSLIFFYAPNRDSATASPATSREALARVASDEITVSDLTRRKESVQQRFGGQINLAMFGGDRRFLDALIQERIAAREAARLGLTASDAEVAEAIRKQFSDASGKFVGTERYKEIVNSQYGDVTKFEEQIRAAIAGDKLRAFVTAGVRVPDAEVQDDYVRQNTTFDLVYVPVGADQLAKSINPSDDELRKYYEEHKNEFRINEPQKKIRYLFVDQNKVGGKLQISDEDLRKEYDGLKPENKQAGVRAQQIVLKVARPELDGEVRAKAEGLVQQARSKGATVSEEAFAELARGNSEDPATAKGGGALAGVVRKNPNKPDDPLQSTLTMEPGQVSEPIKFGTSYYIFRRGDAVEKTFEDAKPELLVSLRNRRAYGGAADIAKRAADRLKETKDVEKVAAEFAAEANMSQSEMVRETSFIKPGDDVPNIGSSPQFEDAILPLENAGDVGDRVSVKEGFAVPMLVEKREPRVPDLA